MTTTQYQALHYRNEHEFTHCRGRNVSLVLKKPFICSCCYNLNTRIFKKRRIVRTSAVKCKVKFCDFADIKIVIGAFAMYFFLKNVSFVKG
jgi:hypothetical protein